ncbi:collagen binding domain-containing protein [Kitasatospora sp. NRRL B-11411]|uniref:MSCRAMM family protein n=1 Tax=Kitasatospora sp. NRRL B-11411 TaxID=1463822 RepID=UPI0035104D1D
MGTYYWQETAAPPGYDLPGQNVSTVVLGTDGQNVPVTVQDTRTPTGTGSTTVTKVDSERIRTRWSVRRAPRRSAGSALLRVCRWVRTTGRRRRPRPATTCPPSG